MQITLYRRSFAVAGSPVSHSFIPDRAGQIHTFTADGHIHEAKRREVDVTGPDGAKVDPLRNVLRWGSKPTAVATAEEVFDLATTKERGFNVV